MNKEKYFNIINKEFKSEIKIKNSIFICHICFIESPEEAKKYISEISSKYKDANHNCWAYISGKNAEIFHSSDNGEPSGTAGKPILNTLQKYNMTNIVAVVTRYFGGVKLGVRGLIDAYSESTESTINLSDLIPLIEMSEYIVITSYDFSETLKYKFKVLNAEITDIQYTDKVEFIIIIQKSISEELENYLTEMEKQHKIEFQNI